MKPSALLHHLSPLDFFSTLITMDNVDTEIGGFRYYVAGIPNEIVIIATLPSLLDNADETEGMTPDKQFENLSLLD